MTSIWNPHDLLAISETGRLGRSLCSPATAAQGLRFPLARIPAAPPADRIIQEETLDRRSDREVDSMKARMTQAYSAEADALSRRRVLLVDDDALASEFAHAVLNDAGAEVVIAQHAEEAIRLAAYLPINVAVLDLNMPGRTGWELMEQLRASYADLRIVVLSGHVDHDLRERYRPDAVVWKPYRGHQLVAAVRGIH